MVWQPQLKTRAVLTLDPQGNAGAKSEFLCQYQDCFQGIGCFHGEFRISLNPMVPPVIHPPCWVPVALREPLKKELDVLIDSCISPLVWTTPRTFSKRNLPGITGITNDIVINYGNDLVDHDANLKAVMEHSRETRHCFNADKCKIRCTEVPFFGHIVSASSLRPDPQKVEAIISMDPSTSLAVLQTFLGMTQFFSCYVPNKASHSATLWDLTKGSSKFQWQPHHKLAVDKIKEAISSANLLQYFSSTKLVTIQVDASSCGLGANLFQDKGPTEYRSKLLIETESQNSNIKAEMLAVVGTQPWEVSLLCVRKRGHCWDRSQAARGEFQETPLGSSSTYRKDDA